MGRIATLRGGRQELPKAPPEIAEEVELYARESGRTATLHFVPFGGFFARFELRCNDPRMKLYQEGMTDKPPSEDVWFHVPNPNRDKPGQAPYIPLDIYQMGPSGVRKFLEQGNTWSGRGEHASLVEAQQKAKRQEEDRKERLERTARERAIDMAKDRRRGILGIPFVGVLTNLRNNNKDTK